MRIDVTYHSRYHLYPVTVLEFYNIFQAMKRSLVYPHYAWILYSFYPDKWWTEEVAKEHLEECSDQELEDFLLKSHALIIHLVPEPDDWNRPTAAGLVCL